MKKEVPVAVSAGADFEVKGTIDLVLLCSVDARKMLGASSRALVAAITSSASTVHSVQAYKWRRKRRKKRAFLSLCLFSQNKFPLAPSSRRVNHYYVTWTSSIILFSDIRYALYS